MHKRFTSNSQVIHRQRAWSILIGAALFFVYSGLRQANLTYDGAAFITFYNAHGAIHPHHPLWGYFLNLCLNLGRACGLTLVEAGHIQSALTTAIAGVVYFSWLKRLDINLATAFVFTAIIGVAGTWMEIGTTVELYGIALLAVTLSLHAWLSELREPGRRGAFELWVACFLVVGLHVAWAVWVLVVYLTLAWNERARIGRAMWRIAEGAAIAIAIAAWLYWGGQFEAKSLGRQEHFFGMFFRGNPFLNFFIGFVVNGGFIVAAGIYGAMRFRKSEPALFMAWALATGLFFVCFGFWIPDRGEFFLPVLAIWGYFGARAFEVWASNGRRLEFSLALVVYAGLIIGAIWLEPKGLFAAAFWIFAVASAWLGWRAAGQPEQEYEYRAPSRAIHVVAFALTVALYTPLAVQALKPDAVTKQLDLFKEVAPPGARFVTAIPPYRPFAQTEHESLSIGDAPGAVDADEARVILLKWIGELQAGGPAVWFDETSWKQRKELLGDLKWEHLSIQHDMRKGAEFWGLSKD